MITLWGWGGVKFEYNDTIEFAHGEGRITFQQDQNTYKSKSGNMIKRLNGYRALINVKIWNDTDTDAAGLKSLFSILNDAGSNAITIYPRFDSVSGSTLSYEVYCNSDISMIDIAQVPVGQYIELEFIGSELLSEIPTLSSNPSTYYVIDNSGNTVVDASGNQLIAII